MIGVPNSIYGVEFPGGIVVVISVRPPILHSATVLSPSMVKLRGFKIMDIRLVD